MSREASYHQQDANSTPCRRQRLGRRIGQNIHRLAQPLYRRNKRLDPPNKCVDLARLRPLVVSMVEVAEDIARPALAEAGPLCVAKERGRLRESGLPGVVVSRDEFGLHLCRR